MTVIRAGMVVAAAQVYDELMLQREIGTHECTEGCPSHRPQD